MPKLIYLSAEQLELIHAGVLAKSGGLFGTRVPETLKGLEASPLQAVFGKELYPTIFQKAAVYTRSIIAEHPFADGNKRTGMLAGFTFLEVNGYRMSATESETFDQALVIATQKPSIEEIARWLTSHSKKSSADSKGKKK